MTLIKPLAHVAPVSPTRTFKKRTKFESFKGSKETPKPRAMMHLYSLAPQKKSTFFLKFLDEINENPTRTTNNARNNQRCIFPWIKKFFCSRSLIRYRDAAATGRTETAITRTKESRPGGEPSTINKPSVPCECASTECRMVCKRECGKCVCVEKFECPDERGEGFS